VSYSTPFLGACEACGQLFTTYRSFGGHLRHALDQKHQELKIRWREWATTNRLRRFKCMKCGVVRESRASQNTRRCNTCQRLRETLGKKHYEELTCALEARLSERLKEDNLIFELNVWQSIPINGKKVPREADIKVDLGAGRKLVILCDGEAFHGPP